MPITMAFRVLQS